MPPRPRGRRRQPPFRSAVAPAPPDNWAPPHDVEAEEQVLGAVLNGDLQALEHLGEDDFYRPEHRTIYRAIRELADPGHPIDPIAVKGQIERHGGPNALADVGGAPFLHTLYSGLTTISEAIAGHADTVKQLAASRRLLDAAYQTRQMVADGIDPATVVEQATKLLTDAANGAAMSAFTDRLLTITQLDALPDPAYLIDQVLADRAITWIVGPPGSGKTILAVEFSHRVTAGLWWLDHQVEQGPVLYVLAEDPSGFKARSRAWRVANNVHDHQLTELVVYPTAVNLFDPGQDYAELLAWCRRRRPRLVVFDTQARCSVGADENSSQDMGIVIDHLEQVRTATGGAIAVVHHTPRSGTNPRGSTALEGAADRVIQTERSDNRVTVKFSDDRPAKNDAQPDRIHLSLHVVEGTGSVVLRPLSGSLIDRDQRSARERVLDLMRLDPGRLGLSAADFIEQTGVSKPTVHRVLSTLVSEDVALKKGHVYYLKEAPPEDP